uniref:Uncharacterized protein n=1 Tax=Romanomermis culicivorax TaxID=13658 RepID=A0A915JC07_ROMCU
MFKCVLYLLAAAAAVYGQTCDFKAYHECLKADESGVAKEEPFGDMKAIAEKCLTDSGCKSLQTATNVNAEKVVKCFEDVQEVASKDILTCIQTKYPSFSLPAHDSKTQKFHLGPMLMAEKDEIEKRINESCPDDASRQNFKKCVMEKLKSVVGQKPKFDLTAMKTKMCEKKKKCDNILSVDCKTQMAQVKEQACTCAKTELTTKADAFKTQIGACLPADFVAQMRAKFANAQKDGAAKDHINQILDAICGQKDICA